MVASLQCRCHLETATIKHRIERNDDQIEPFFDSIGQSRRLSDVCGMSALPSTPDVPVRWGATARRAAVDRTRIWPSSAAY